MIIPVASFLRTLVAFCHLDSMERGIFLVPDHGLHLTSFIEKRDVIRV